MPTPLPRFPPFTECMQKYAFAILAGIELENCFLVPSVCLIRYIQIIAYDIGIFNYELSLRKIKTTKLIFHNYYLFQAIINSTITPNMTFTKTSQKFGQWADSRANTVYGLGFSSEHHLSKVSMTPDSYSAGEAT